MTFDVGFACFTRYGIEKLTFKNTTNVVDQLLQKK